MRSIGFSIAVIAAASMATLTGPALAKKGRSQAGTEQFNLSECDRRTADQNSRPPTASLQVFASDSDRIFTVTTVATDPAQRELSYNYTVSGGRVSGEGARVVWDLSRVSPGTYQITAIANGAQGCYAIVKYDVVFDS